MFQVTARNKAMTTPARTPLCVPKEALALAIQAEWEALKGVPKREQIPMTQYANTAIDHTAKNPAAAIAAILTHAAYDVLCYRAGDNPALYAHQTAQWQPWLTWAKQQHQIDLWVFDTLMPQTQNPEALKTLEAYLQQQDSFTLLAIAQAAGLFSSAILALAFVAEAITPQQAIAAALADELFQSAQWGEPEELKEKRDSLAKEVADLARYVQLLRA